MDSFRKAVLSLGSFLLRPLKGSNRRFFLFYIVLAGLVLPAIMFFANRSGTGFALSAIAGCYIYALVIEAFPWRGARVALRAICCLLYSLLAISALFIRFALKASMSAEHVSLIVYTNPAEASDFAQTYATPVAIILTILVMALIVLGAWMLSRIHVCNTTWRKCCKVGLFFVALVCSLFVVKYNMWRYAFLGIVGEYINMIEPHYNLEQTQTLPVVELTDYEHPGVVALIIGESFDRKHASLYGYKLPTTPKLDSLESDGKLFPFVNAKSRAVNTLPSFKYMLSDYDIDDGKWEKGIMLPTIMAKAGYKTIWVTNQGSSPLYDSVPFSFAALCDTTLQTNGGLGNEPLDECIIPLIHNALPENQTEAVFVVAHLMGSHFNYGSRYPSGFARFKADDYIDKPENQRTTLRDYDNSILYNDYIVAAILEIVEHQGGIAIYLSDHGQDMFVSSADYAGHGNHNFPASMAAAQEVPFVIYLSDEIKRTKPELADSLLNHRSDEFFTDHLSRVFERLSGINVTNKLK